MKGRKKWQAYNKAFHVGCAEQGKKKALVIIIIAVITETYSARNIPTSSRLPRAKIVIQTIIQSWE